jgi:hypothetical protein
VLDEHGDGDVGRLRRGEAGEPGVVAVEVPGAAGVFAGGAPVRGLRGAGLAGHVDVGEALAEGGALLVVDHVPKGVHDELPVLGAQLDALFDPRGEVLHDRPVARLDRAHDLRLVERAAVGERGVGERQLQHADGGGALADGGVEGEAAVVLPLVVGRVPRPGGDAPGRLGVDAEAGLLAEAVLEAEAGEAVEADGVAELVKIDVARAGDGLAHVDAAVLVGAAEDAAAVDDVVTAVDLGARVDELLFEGGEGAEGLVRRAGRVRAGDGLVEGGLERVGVQAAKRVANGLHAEAAREHVRVEAGLRIEGEHAPGAHVDGDGGAGDLAAHGAVDCLDELDVERQPQVAPGHRVEPARLVEQAVDPHGGGAGAAGADEGLFPAATAAQVALPAALDAGGAEAVALDVAGGAQAHERLAVDLGHVAEGVRAQLAVRVVAHRHGNDVDALELGLVRLERGDGVAADVFAHEQLLELARLRVFTGLVADLVEALFEAGALFGAEAQVVDGLGPRLGLGDAHGSPALELPGHGVDVVRGAVGGEHVPVGVAHDAPRGGERDAAHDVLARGGAVLVAEHDLQEEQAAEDGEEDEQDERGVVTEAAAELADVGALPEEAHRRGPSAARGTEMVAWCRRAATRKVSGAKRAVEAACGKSTEARARGP